MKPRTAEELAAWSAQGIDIEFCDRAGLSAEGILRYRRENAEEHRMNGNVDAMIKRDKERWWQITTGTFGGRYGDTASKYLNPNHIYHVGPEDKV